MSWQITKLSASLLPTITIAYRQPTIWLISDAGDIECGIVYESIQI